MADITENCIPGKTSDVSGAVCKHLDMDNCNVKTFVDDVNLFILHIKYWNIRIVYRRHGKWKLGLIFPAITWSGLHHSPSRLRSLATGMFQHCDCFQSSRYLDIHCSAEFTEIILLEVALLVFPAEVRMTEVHTGRGGSGSKSRITHQI